MAFDPNQFNKDFNAKLTANVSAGLGTTSMPMMSSWLMKGPYNIGDIAQNFDKLDPYVQQQVLATDVAGGMGGAFKQLQQSQVLSASVLHTRYSEPNRCSHSQATSSSTRPAAQAH